MNHAHWTLTGIAILSAAAAAGPDWTEVGDAGSFVSSAQTPLGAGTMLIAHGEADHHARKAKRSHDARVPPRSDLFREPRLAALSVKSFLTIIPRTRDQIHTQSLLCSRSQPRTVHLSHTPSRVVTDARRGLRRRRGGRR